MNDGFAWWLLIAGIGIGVALAWLIMGRVARNEGDVDEVERVEEAAWISRSIAGYGGVAPPALVEEILDLHHRYLEGPGLEPWTTPVDDAEAEEPGADLPPGAERPRGTPRRASGEELTG